MIWLTSDTHYNHDNCIKYCNRPFDSVEKMDQSLIDNVNQLVAPSDTLYHLGDFCFPRKDPNLIQSFRERINCKEVHLLIGNHEQMGGIDQYDYSDVYYKTFTSVRDLTTIQISRRQTLTLCHYAMRTWPRSHQGSFHCHGHSHNGLNPEGLLRLDVGVDAQGFKPISLDEVVKILTHRKQLLDKINEDTSNVL